MRCLQRNKVDFYYALFVKKEPILDEYGNETGEFEVIHGKPQKYSANISSAKGVTYVREFGDEVSYDKVIALDNDAPKFDEETIFWVDTLPVLDTNGETVTPHDYIAKKVATGLDSVLIAISKVRING